MDKTVRTTIRGVIGALALVALTAATAFAQGGVTSTLSGTVTDSTGAVVPGANVIVKRADTGVATDAVTKLWFGSESTATTVLGTGEPPLSTVPLTLCASAALVTTKTFVCAVKFPEGLDMRKSCWPNLSSGGARLSVVVIAPVAQLLSYGTLRYVTPPIVLTPPSVIRKVSFSASPESTTPCDRDAAG